MAFSEHEVKAPIESCTVCYSIGSACSRTCPCLSRQDQGSWTLDIFSSESLLWDVQQVLSLSLASPAIFMLSRIPRPEARAYVRVPREGWLGWSTRRVSHPDIADLGLRIAVLSQLTGTGNRARSGAP